MYRAPTYTVKTGNNYPVLIPFYGFSFGKTLLSSWIKFDTNAARYLFPPTDSQGAMCQSSWNKLYGTTRCGFDNHKDSDRFVWRRSISCFNFSGSYVANEIPNCAERDLIELAAYTYDNYAKPFENQGILLKTFNTKVSVNKWYKYQLQLNADNTVFELFDNNNAFLENVTINHRNCNLGSFDLIQSFYFG